MKKVDSRQLRMRWMRQTLPMIGRYKQYWTRCMPETFERGRKESGWREKEKQNCGSSGKKSVWKKKE